MEALDRATQILHDDLELALLFAVRLGETGDHERRREMLTSLMPRFAAAERWAGIEEAALEFSENDHVEGIIEMFRVLPTVVDKGALGEAGTLAGIGFPVLERAERAGEIEAELRLVAAKALEAQGDAGASSFRGPLMVALRQAWSERLPNAEQVFESTGMSDNTKSLAGALERVDRIASLPPGRRRGTTMRSEPGVWRATTATKSSSTLRADPGTACRSMPRSAR